MGEREHSRVRRRPLLESSIPDLVGLPGGSGLAREGGVKTNPGLQFDPVAFLAKTGEGRAASSCASGQVIFAQGDPADAVFYVQNGRIKLTIVSGQGKEAV